MNERSGNRRRPRVRAAATAMDERMAPLAVRVRDRRLELELRQVEVAELAGCSERFVHTLEHGKSGLQLDKVLDVLRVLGLELAVKRGHGATSYRADD